MVVSKFPDQPVCVCVRIVSVLTYSYCRLCNKRLQDRRSPRVNKGNYGVNKSLRAMSSLKKVGPLFALQGGSIPTLDLCASL